MKGPHCELEHPTFHRREGPQRTGIRLWLWEKFPEFSLETQLRTNSFLN